MKKLFITVAALAVCARTALAGIGINWTMGGFLLDKDGTFQGLARSDEVTWQLIHAGPDGRADAVNPSDGDCLGGDDTLLAERVVPAGGGAAADGTSWGEYLGKTGGYSLYEDLQWSGAGSNVYQRVYKGSPAAGAWYYESGLFTFNTNYAGQGSLPDLFAPAAATGGFGVYADRQVPEPTPVVSSFLVRKLYDGRYCDATKYSTVELAVYSAAAANENMRGACLTYVIEGGGINMGGDLDRDGELMKLNGVHDIEQVNHYRATFDDKGWAYIKASLQGDSAIRVTGEFGPYNSAYEQEAPNGKDHRMTLSTSGLLQGQTFYVIERAPCSYYVPTGYVYVGDDEAADPRDDATGMTQTGPLDTEITDETDHPTSEYDNNPDAYVPATVPAGALFLKGEATSDPTTVFVVNKLGISDQLDLMEVEMPECDAVYDGGGLDVPVDVFWTDEEGRHVPDAWTERYALGDSAEPPDDWSSVKPAFTNVCDTTLWVEVSIEGWFATTSAVVRIRPAPLGITARDQTFPHDGQPHGEDRATYTDPADIASKVVVSGLAAGDVLASVTLDGTRTAPGTGPIVPSDAVVTNATGDVTSNYAVGYTNGTLTVAAQPLGPVSYWDPVGGTTNVCTGGTPYFGENTLTSGWWVVSGAVTNGARIVVSGDVNLILCDGAELVAQQGINVAAVGSVINSLTIWAQSDATAAGSNAGSLNAICTDIYSAGIGGSYDMEGGDSNMRNAGSITVNGGNVTAQCLCTTTGYWDYAYGAGIGGGYRGDGGTITINGGRVSASSTANSPGRPGYGAGIGGGSDDGGSGNITISGGVVTASSGYGMAIGRGYAGSSGGSLSLDGMRVGWADDPDNIEWVAADARLSTCWNRNRRPVRVEPCKPHAYENQVCTRCGADAPAVTGVEATPSAPWDGTVTLSFAVTNSPAEAAPDWNRPFLSIVATDNLTGSNYVADISALSARAPYQLAAALAGSNGTHTVVWDMDLQGIDFSSTNVTFTVAYLKMPDYCVIDLSGGTSAESYPVTYLDGFADPNDPAVPNVPTVSNVPITNDLYRTDRLAMRLIAPGTFMMGSTNSLDNNPLHSVALTQPFYCAVFETTQKQWELVTGNRPSWFNNDAFYATRPVEMVSWNAIRGDAATYDWPNEQGVDTNSFVGVLRHKTGLASLDLPTEAQWEYACRAGTTTEYGYGDSPNGEYMWYRDNSAVDSSRQTHEVGTKRPNAWGLYDMHGNVWEWCLDRWSSSGSYRVARGGSWYVSADCCTSSYRGYSNPSDESSILGFRLVRTLSDNPEGERSAEAAAGLPLAGTVCAGESESTTITMLKDIAATVTGYNAPYDGQGHRVEVAVSDPADNDPPVTVSYAFGTSSGTTNTWSTSDPMFTNVCNQTVWVEIAADGYRTVTNHVDVVIANAPLTITAKDQTCVFNGLPQGEDNSVYATPASIAEKVEVEGLAPGDALAGITLDGLGTEVGTYPIAPSAAMVTNAAGANVTFNYAIGYTNGTLTIEAAPQTAVSGIVWKDMYGGGNRYPAISVPEAQKLNVAVREESVRGVFRLDLSSFTDEYYFEFSLAYNGRKMKRSDIRFAKEATVLQFNESDNIIFNSGSYNGRPTRYYLDVRSGRPFTLSSERPSENVDFQPAYDPVAGAVVEILAGDVVAASDTTAADGSYVVTNLPTGAYTVRFSMPEGYDSASHGPDSTVAAAENVTKAEAQITLTENAPTAVVDAGLYRATTSALVWLYWEDEDDLYGARPTSVTLRFADGDLFATNIVVVCPRDSYYPAEVTGLPKYAGGETLEYTVSEPDVPARYEAYAWAGNEPMNFTINHTYVTSEIGIVVTGCTNVYDGIAHTIGVTTNGAIAGLALKYCAVDGGALGESALPGWNSAKPEFTNVTNVTVYVEASAPGYITTTNSTAVTITKRPVTFTGTSETRKFTGTEIEISTVVVSNLVAGHAHNVAFSATGTEVGGPYAGTITAAGDVSITDAGGADATANYDITVANGALTIERDPDLAFEVLLEGATFPYDGEAHALTNAATSTARSGETAFEYARDGGAWTNDLSALTATNVADSCAILVRATNPNYANPATNSASLAVTPRDIALAHVAPVGPQLYAGSPPQPAPAVTDGDPSIITEDDYELSWTENEGPGTGRATVAGRNNYAGTNGVPFAILPPVTATLAWKYAKNANGWHCAQIAIPWHAGYSETISDLRFLFADRTDGTGALTAYLVDPATVLTPLGRTEEHEGAAYRAAALGMPDPPPPDGERAVFGVSDGTLASALDSVPRAERAIPLRVVNRDIATVEPLGNKIGWLAWTSGGAGHYLPLSPSPAAHAAFRPAPSPRPLTAAEANLAAAFGLAPAAVARGRVVCRIGSVSFGADGSAEGTFAIAAEDAAGVLSESGELAPDATLTVLGAEGLGEAFRPLDPASCGVELTSRTPPYAFRVRNPGNARFLRVRLDAEDRYE